MQINERTKNLLSKIGMMSETINDNFYFAISGGFAIDGHYGTFTRSHDDIDVIIYRKSVASFQNTLATLGYQSSLFSHPQEESLMYKLQTDDEPHTVGAQILDPHEKKSVTIGFYNTPRLILARDLFKTVPLTLGGVSFQGVSQKLLLLLKNREVCFLKTIQENKKDIFEKKLKKRYMHALQDVEILS